MGKLIKYFKEKYILFQRQKWNVGLTRKLFPDAKYTIEYAFTIAGIDYFQFTDINMLCYERALMSLAIYDEMRMKCDKEYLDKHCEAIDFILKNKDIDIFKIRELNEQMKQRLEFSLNVDSLYKLASVIFFDANEHPHTYDVEYNKKKIEAWKDTKDADAFFFMQPIKELMPFLTEYGELLPAYLQLSREMNMIHLENILTFSSHKPVSDLKAGKQSSKKVRGDYSKIV